MAIHTYQILVTLVWYVHYFGYKSVPEFDNGSDYIHLNMILVRMICLTGHCLLQTVIVLYWIYISYNRLYHALNEHTFTSLIIAILSQDSHLTYISV